MNEYNHMWHDNVTDISPSGGAAGKHFQSRLTFDGYSKSFIKSTLQVQSYRLCAINMYVIGQ